MKLLLSLIFTLAIVSFANGHGYSVYPAARQVICVNNPANSIWYPPAGGGLVDAQCKAAYQHVYNKYGGSESAAQNQFVQINEYAVLIPNYSAGASALQAAVPSNICGAGASNSNAQFGDKSGFSIGFNWPATKIKVPAGSNSFNITYTWCSTATHIPHYFEFYVTKVTYNPANPVTWNDLVLIKTQQNLQVFSGGAPGCSTSSVFKTTLNLPARYQNSVLVSRYQRIDPAGECFINCSDFVFVN